MDYHYNYLDNKIISLADPLFKSLLSGSDCFSFQIIVYSDNKIYYFFYKMKKQEMILLL